ncbi:MAG TPA: hypothetical protein VKV02_08690, partial [Acidobacteriaceae bacterium]|nr:hypothetical protein [Acidobacteriaceae bacterium]
MGPQIESALRQSTHRVIGVLGAFLPGVVVFLLSIIVLALFGWVLAAVCRAILVRLRFDERVSAWRFPGALTTLGDWSPAHSPTALIARSLFWICIVVGVAVGITGFDAAYEANSQVELFVLPYLTHLIGAILLLFIGGLIARFLSRSVLISAVNAQLQYARVLSLGVKWLVLVLTAAMALDHLRIGGTIVELAFGILFGGIVFALSLAVGLGSRDLVSRSIERIERPS